MRLPNAVKLLLLSCLASVVAIPTTDISSYETGPAIASYFRKALTPGVGIFLPSDKNYTSETTQRWNADSEPTYLVSVKPATESDVQKIILFAFNNHIPFLGTGGGHAYTTTVASVQKGIELDLSGFHGVEINANASTMTAGGAVTFANITSKLHAAGKEFQVGSCSCVGLVGATLGGGIGPYGGLHGLMIDALQSARIVTGTGEILTVSATENADLFWGLRGAGHNYGIITNATWNVYPFTNNGQAMSADMRFAISKNASIWEFVASFSNNQPDQLTLDLGIAYDTKFDGAYILFSIIYAGPLSSGLEIIQPLLDLGPLTHNITVIPWKDIESKSRYGVDASACVKGRLHSVYGLNLYQIDVPSLVQVSNYVTSIYTQYPALQFALLALVKYGSRVVTSVPDDATAYPYRNVMGYVHFDVAFPTTNLSALANSVGANGRSILQSGSGANTTEVYVNYAHGDEGPDAWYAPRKLPRLLRLKRRYDPNNLFNHYNGLQGPVGS